MHTISSELKLKHRAMWASGDYPGDGRDVPHAARPAPRRGVRDRGRPARPRRRRRHRQRLDPRRRARRPGRPPPTSRPSCWRPAGAAPTLDLEWVEADAEALPFADESFDVVMSAIGVMFAPHHADAAAELVRVCRAGRHARPALAGRPRACSARCSARWRRSRRRRRPARRPLRCGAARRTCAASSASASSGSRWSATCCTSPPSRAPTRLRRALQGPLRPDDRRSAPTPSATAAPAEFDAALDAFCDEWNLGPADEAPVRDGVPARRRHARYLSGPARSARGATTRRASPGPTDTWWSTVLGEITSASAISAFVAPVAQVREHLALARRQPSGRRAGGGRGPRGILRTPSARSRRRRCAATRVAPSSSKIGERLQPALLVADGEHQRRLVAEARSRAQAAAAPRQSPAAARA